MGQHVSGLDVWRTPVVEFREEAVRAALDPTRAGDLALAPQRRRLMVLTMASVLVLGGICMVPFEENATVMGELRVQGLDALVQAPSGGVVKEVMVQPDQIVLAGQELVRLSTPELEAAIGKAEAEAATARTKDVPVFERTAAEAAQKVAQQEEQVRLAERKITRAQSFLSAKEQLLKEGLVAKFEVSQAAGAVEEAQAELSRARQALSSLRSEHDESRRKRDLGAVSPETNLASLKAQRDGMVLKARTNGRVEWVGTVAGRFIQPGETLVRVVPEKPTFELVGAARVDDLGKLRAGLRAKIEWSGFEPGDFGYGKATLTAVGKDVLGVKEAQAISPEVESGRSYVQVLLQPAEFGQVRPEPGLRAKVRVVLWRRSLLQRFLAKVG